MMARLIPGAKLVIIAGCGHRVLWESTERCADLITEFIDDGSIPINGRTEQGATTSSDGLISAIEFMANWPSILARAGFDSMALVQQSMMVGSASRFGDGKPIILVTRFLGSDLVLFPFAIWLKALGYRPITASSSLHLEDPSSDDFLAQVIQSTAQRIGRKAVLITHAFGMMRALRIADLHKQWISDVIIIGPSYGLEARNVRTHVVSSWPALHALTELPRVLRTIDLELIPAADLDGLEGSAEMMDVEDFDASEDGNA